MLLNRRGGHEVRSWRLEDFVGCKVHFSYSTHQEPFANGEPAPDKKPYRSDHFLSLGDIDPANIRFAKGPGDRLDVPSFFTIRARNDEKKITSKYSGLTEASDTSLILTFDSVGDNDYVVRFATAFKHAVEACGGKPSLYADSDRRVDRGLPTSGDVARQSSPSRKDIPSIAKAASGAIASVVMSDKDGNAIAQGTGFFVSKDGLIVTNYHVIAEGNSAVVKLPGGAFYVVDGVVASDKARDVAVIKARGQNFQTLTLGNSDRVQIGEDVVAIGNPLSLESTVSNGIVSGIRAVKEEGGNFLQVTAPISPGSSGGPLFNMAGEVIGITTSYLEGGENLNFAIPINDMKHLLPVNSSKLLGLPNETKSVKAQTHHGDAPSAGAAQTPASSTGRDYYKHLFDAGGFSGNLPGYVCFSDDDHLGTFFTFRAYAYDADYYNAQSRLPTFQEKVASGSDTVAPEEQKQFDIMAARQRTAPYVTLLMKGWLESFSPEAQQFFRSGGRILAEDIYEKGVKVNTLEYRWDGTSWFLKIPPADPNAYTRTNKVLRLSIEPTTMRYVDSESETITVGSGETAASDTANHGPWPGVCEKVPNPK
ncbi:MAG: trypsin-like peptidase domain-containing protein [Candidatus Acidiferrales bacterium]